MMQAVACESIFGKLAFRIKDYTRDVNLVIPALSALQNAENALVFIDSQYIRESYSASLAATISIINLIRTQVPNTIISTLATSFPVSVLPYAREGQSGAMDIIERQFHGQIGGYSIAAYGDYGSVHAIVYDNDPSVMRWSPRVDYPQELDWEFERSPGVKAKDGYILAAQKIVSREPDIGSRNIWGEDMILNAATGKETVGSSPASWIAVRVNIHLSRQIDFTQQLLNSNGQELDEDFDF